MSIKLKDTIYDNIDKLSSSAGNATQPIYFNGGKPAACTYSLNKSVPSDSKFTDTTYSAGSGLSLSGTTFNHISTVTAGTAGTSSATSGSTIAIPYVTVNATGHVTGYGTHTHTVTGSGLSGSDYVAKTGDVMTGSLELPNSNSALKIGTSSFTYGSSLVQIKARNDGEGYSLLIERDNTSQQAFIGFPCKTVNNGGDSVYFGIGSNTNGALSSIVVCSSSQKSACGLRIQGEGSSVSESYINYFTKTPGKDAIYRGSTGWSSLFGNSVSGAFLMNGQNEGFIVVDDDSHFLKTNRIFRSLIDYSGEGSYSAEFLTYTNNPYGIIMRSNSSGMQSIQSQRESNNSEVFPLVLNPLGGYVGINNNSPKCSLDTGAGHSRSRFYYFSDKSSSGEAGFVGRGSSDDTVYLGAYSTNRICIYSKDGSIYLQSNHGIVIGLISEIGSPRALLDVKGHNSSVIIGNTGGYSSGTSSARKLRLGLGTVGHTGSQYWTFCVDDTTDSSYLQIGYTIDSIAMSIRHDGLVNVSSFAIGGQTITFVT